MRMIPVLAIVVALGLSLMVLGGLGVSDYFGSSGEVGLTEEISNQTDENQTLQPEEGDNGGGFLTFVVGTVSQIRDLMGLVIFLPSTLHSLGAPEIIARAIGHGTQIVIIIGMLQVALQYTIK